METPPLRHVIRRKVAKLARFSPLALFFCFYILYATMRVKYDDVWSGIYFLSLYGIIMETARLWAPKWIYIAYMLLYVPASVYVISFYFLVRYRKHCRTRHCTFRNVGINLNKAWGIFGTTLFTAVNGD
jgi:hypothetical protein